MNDPLRVSERVFVDGFFAKSKICQLDVAFGVQKNIFRLQVSVDDALAVQVLQCQSDLSNVEAGLEQN